MKNPSNKQNSQHEIQLISKEQKLKTSHISNKSLHNSNNHLHNSNNSLKQTQTNQQSTLKIFNANLIKNKTQNDTSFGSNMVLDYQNAKFQGKLVNKIQTKKTQKIQRGGLGILMDDDLNFIVSNWKNDQLYGKTVLINRNKNYFYSTWNQQTQNPSGPAVMRINSFIIITKFSEKTGKWALTQTQRNVVLIYDESTSNLLILTGKMQESSNEYKCSKSSPLTVVEFVHFDDSQEGEKQQGKSKNNYRQRQEQSTKQILSLFCQKYSISIEEYELTLPQFLQEIGKDAQKNCAKSKNFALNVSKNLLSDIYVNQNEYLKESQSYESKKHKLFDNNCIVFKQLLKKSQTSKQVFSYFGFLGGLGIKFVNQQRQIKSSKCIKQSQSSIRLKSIGNHNLNFKIQDIGGRFYDNKCIEQGNFKTKSTFTYEDVLFRPSNKLVSIYNKYHKQQTHFINQYFDKNKLTIFKLLANFQAFVDQHVIYVMNQCYLQTTKFQQKQQKNQLVSSLLSLKNKIDKVDQNQRPEFHSRSKSNIKNPNYQVKIQRKSKSKSKGKCQQKYKQPLSALKNKNNEFKERIRKVKYEIQYEPQPKNENVIVMNDDKFMSKIKKHLTTAQHSKQAINKSISASKINKNSRSKSKSKSQISYRPKNKKGYIQKQKQKILSHTKVDLNDDSLERIDGVIIKKVHMNDKNAKEKTQGEKLLQKINGNIGFKQKFNYGIEYHKEHESFRSRTRQSPQKNKYNGRQRMFTDHELDQELQNNNFSIPQVPVRSITPGTKSRKKQQYRHYIYSNTQRNVNNQEEQYQHQKQVQQTIRAQMLGLTLQQYKEKMNQQKNYEKFLDKKLLSIVDLQESILSISRRKQSIAKIDANQTFGIQQDLNIEQSRTKKDRQLSLSVKQRLAVKKAEDKYLKNGQRTYNPIICCPKPKQESLVQRRLRILQEYKRLNEKQEPQYAHITQSQIGIKSSMLSIKNSILSPLKRSAMFKDNEWIKMTPTQTLRKDADLKKLPIYQQKMAQKVLSPLRTVKDDFSTIQAYPQRSNYLYLDSVRRQLNNEVVNSIKKQPTIKQKINKGLKVENYLESSNKGTKKYQYYFDK